MPSAAFFAGAGAVAVGSRLNGWPAVPTAGLFAGLASTAFFCAGAFEPPAKNRANWDSKPSSAGGDANVGDPYPEDPNGSRWLTVPRWDMAAMARLRDRSRSFNSAVRRPCGPSFAHR